VMGHKDCIEPLQMLAVDDAALTTRLFYLFNQRYTWPSITEAEEQLLYCEPMRGQVQGQAFDSLRCEVFRYRGVRNEVRGELLYVGNHCRRLTHNMITLARSPRPHDARTVGP